MERMAKVFLVFAYFLSPLSIFIAGLNFADDQSSKGVFNLALGLLWLAIIIVEHESKAMELKWLKKLRKLDESFNNLILDTLKKQFEHDFQRAKVAKKEATSQTKKTTKKEK